MTEALHPSYSTWKDLNRRLSQWSQQILKGKTNNIGEVTLTENADTTDVVDRNLGIDSVILFQPMTSNAALEVKAGGMYVSEADYDIPNNTFTINHSNNGQTDKDFRYVIIG